jgi:hypothetical protein
MAVSPIAGASGGANGAIATPAPPSPQQVAYQQLLELANNPGVTTGGGYVSNAGARAAVQGAYNTAEGNRQQVYSQAINNVLANAPAIQQGYDNASSAIENNAAARQAADSAAADQRSSNAALAAQRMGLTFVPTASGRANATQDAYGTQYKTNADSWAGLLSSQKQTALSGNTRTANAFQYSGTQAQAALASLLSNALSKLKDTYSAGKTVGATTPATAAAIYEKIYGLNTAQAKMPTSPTTTTATKSVGGKAVSSTVTTKK